MAATDDVDVLDGCTTVYSSDLLLVTSEPGIDLTGRATCSDDELAT